MNKPFFQSKKMLLAAAASLAVAGCGGAATEKSAKPERPSTPYSTAESEDLNPPPAAESSISAVREVTGSTVSSMSGITRAEMLKALFWMP